MERFTRKKNKSRWFMLGMAMLSALCSLLPGIRGKEKVSALTSSDTTSYVSVGEIYDSTTGEFKESEMTTLLRYVLNSNDLDVGSYDDYIPSTVSETTGLSAGDMRGDSTSTTGGKDIVVTFGGLKWQVTYLSKDKDGNDILTLWLATSQTSSRWGHSSYSSSFTASTPSSLYGASYIRSVINNGADTDGDGDYGANVYSNSYSTTTMTAYTPSDTSIFKPFTDTSETGLAQYIVKPEKVTWQESSQNAKTQLGYSYRCPNENWADYGVNSTSSEWSTSNNGAYNMTAHSYYSAWKNDFLWLPSLTETGYSDTKIGIWETSTAQRANGSYSWLRSGIYGSANGAYYLNSSGASYGNSGVNYSYAVRPSLHLNLSSAADSAAPGDPISGGEISIDSTAHEYDGVVRTPVVAVSLNGNQLVENTDFKVSYKLNGAVVPEIKDAGVYEVIAKGTGAYKKSLKTTYTVTSRPLSNATIPNAVTMTYTGSNINQTLEVIDSGLGVTLTQDVDYVLTYENNTNIGVATITITGINNYAGSDSRTFEITTLDMSDSSITVDSLASQTYTGSAFTLLPVVKLNGVTLVKDTDYTLAYADNVNKGTATITITGKGNFSGSRDVTFEIVARSITGGTVTVGSVTYTGDALIPSTTLKVNSRTLEKDVDYSVSCTNNVNQGTGNITITGIGNYSGSISKTFTINKRAISSATIEAIPNQQFTGSLIKPALSLSYNGYNLALNSAYSADYSSNIALGTASVLLTGLGNFTGTVTKTFSIVANDISDDTFTLAKTSYNYTGEEVTLKETLVVAGVTLIRGDDYTLTIHKDSVDGEVVTSAKNSGTYYLVATGKKNYTSTNSVQFVINSANLANGSIVLDSNSLNYTGSENIPTFQVKMNNIVVNSANYSVKILKDGVETTPIEVGTYTIEVSGANSYEGSLSTTYTISPKNISNAVITYANESYTYTGSAITPEITSITLDSLSILEFVDITYSNNIGATSTATITATASGNYTGTASCYFTINKATLKQMLTFSVNGNSATNGEYSIEYTGEALDIETTIYDSNNNILNENDYIIEYKRNNSNTTNLVDMGTIVIVVSPKLNSVTSSTNLTGVSTGTITITPIIIENAYIEVTGSYEYNNTPITPEFVVYEDNTKSKVIPSNQYTSNISQNTEAGDGSVVITFNGNYSGTAYSTFTISQRNISNWVITLDDTPITYDGTAKTVTFELSDTNGANLTNQYTYTYVNNINAGTASIIFTGIDNYTGTISKTFTISPISIEDMTIDNIANQIYTGNEIRPEIVVRKADNSILGSGNYTVAYSSNTLAGTATVVVTGSGNYTGSISTTYEIVSADISNATISDVSDITYTGLAITPKLSITFYGETLLENTDYTVSYSNNINVGTATITIAGIGGFVGSATKTFNIIPADINNIVLRNILSSYTYTGSAINNLHIYNAYYNNILVSSSGDDQMISVAYSNNINVGTATITITPFSSDSQPYLNFTGTKTITFEITKATITYSMVTLDSNSYVFTGSEIKPIPVVTFNGDTLVQDVDYTLSYSADATNVGEKLITITAIEDSNFRGTFNLKYYITPKAITGVTIADIEDMVYTRNSITPSAVVSDNSKTLVLNTDYTLEYSNNIEVGTATITIRGKGNYLNTTNASKTFNITPATISEITLNSNTKVYDRKTSVISATSVVATDITLFASEYTLKYYRGDVETSDLINSGVITVKVLSNSDNFQVEDEVSTTYTITKAIIDRVTLVQSETIYNGADQSPVISKVYSSNNLLLSSSEYLSLFSRSLETTTDFTNAGTITITISSNSDNFQVVETVTTEYTINRKSITDSDMDIKYYFVTYDSSTGEYTPLDLNSDGKKDYMLTDQKYIAYLVHPEIKFNSITEIELIKGTAFTFTILNTMEEENVETATKFIEVGEYVTTITGMGNYTGTLTDIFKVNPQDFSEENVTITFVNGNNYDFTGNKITLDLASELYITYEQDGQAPVEIKLHSDTAEGPTYKLVDQETITYTKDGESYEITFEPGNFGYLNNTSVGTAMLFLEGVNNFTGYICVEFNITPIDITNTDTFTFELEETNYTYSGSAFKPELTTHKYIDTDLIIGEDYTISYENNVNAGTGKVIITAINNYSGIVEIEFDIAKKVLDNSMLLTINNPYYNGEEQKPDISLIYNSMTVSDSDYTISYSSEDFVNASSIVITITAKDNVNYTGTITHTYSILPRTLRSVKLSVTSGVYNYDAHSITFVIRDMDNMVVSQTSDNLTIKYYNSKSPTTEIDIETYPLVNVGEYIIKITGLNNYTGELTATYSITAMKVGIDMLTAIDNQIYLGSVITPSIQMTYLTHTMTKDSDFEVTYSNNTNVGIAEATITGINNFSGEFTAYFNITPQDINDIDYIPTENITIEYTGNVLLPSDDNFANSFKFGDYTLVINEDFIIYSATSSVNVGSYNYQIKGIGNYTGTITKQFAITEKDISDEDIIVSGVADKYYTGSNIRQDNITITNSISNTLLYISRDYEISYSNNIDVVWSEGNEIASALITITSKSGGNYKGTREVYFKILAKPLTDSEITVATPDPVAYTGSAHTPKPEVKFNSTILTEDIITYSWEDNVEFGRATVIITAKENTNFKGEIIRYFEIGLTDMGDIEVSGITSSLVYNGTIQKQVPTLTSNGVEMIRDTDYTLTYSDDLVNAGTITITVRGINNFSGTKVIQYVIAPLTLSDSSVVIEDVDPQVFTGSGITPIPVITYLSNNLVYAKDFTLSYSHNVNVSNAACIMIDYIGNYSGSSLKAFTISPKLITTDMVTGLTTKTYTGSEIEQTFNISYNGIDYSSELFIVNYRNNTNVGTAYVDITGKDNFTGTITATFEIVQKTLTNSDVELNLDDTYIYTGSQITPNFDVIVNSITLSPSNDYTYTFGTNINAGEGEVFLEFKGNYAGIITAHFDIEQVDLSSNLILSTIENSIAYTGSANYPQYSLTYQSYTLTTSDYSISYLRNNESTNDLINAGTIVVRLTGKNNFKGSLDLTYNITPKLLSSSDIEVGFITSNLSYTGSEVCPEVIVTMGASILELGTDYTLSYSNNTNATTSAVLVITAVENSNYQGTKQVTFTIERKELNISFVADIETQTYTASEIRPAVSLQDGDYSLVSGVDYTVAYLDNTSVGTASIQITGIGNYTGSVTQYFTIDKTSLASCEITGLLNEYVFNLTAIKPNVTISINTRTLTAGVDYSLNYSEDCVNIGEKTITVVGLGNYKGSAMFKYSVIAKDLSDVEIEVVGIENKHYALGTEILQEFVVKHSNNTIYMSDSYSVEYSNNINAGTATITLTGKGNYTGTKVVNFNILRLDTTAQVACADDEIYEGNSINLEVINSSVEGRVRCEQLKYVAGNYTYNWTFIPNDTVNYNVCTGTIVLTSIALQVIGLDFEGDYKKEYLAYETFDTTNLIVNLVYNSGKKETLNTNKYTISHNVGSLLKINDIISVTYNNGDIEITEQLDIVVRVRTINANITNSILIANGEKQYITLSFTNESKLCPVEYIISYVYSKDNQSYNYALNVGKYKAIITILDENYMLENNQIEFEVYRKTISSSDNSIVIESDNGFGENEQFACDVIVDLGTALTQAQLQSFGVSGNFLALYKIDLDEDKEVIIQFSPNTTNLDALQIYKLSNGKLQLISHTVTSDNKVSVKCNSSDELYVFDGKGKDSTSGGGSGGFMTIVYIIAGFTGLGILILIIEKRKSTGSILEKRQPTQSNSQQSSAKTISTPTNSMNNSYNVGGDQREKSSSFVSNSNSNYQNNNQSYQSSITTTQVQTNIQTQSSGQNTQTNNATHTESGDDTKELIRQYVIFNEGGRPIGLREGAPEQLKKAFDKYLNIKNN